MDTDPVDGKVTNINLIDTPGHADFGGEVERVLRMVDSVCLLVDAFEGPMPQTRFVHEEGASSSGFAPSSSSTRSTGPRAATSRVLVNDVFDLFVSLGADGRDSSTSRSSTPADGPATGTRSASPTTSRPKAMHPAARGMILEKVPGPARPTSTRRCSMQVATLDYRRLPRLRIAVGRIYRWSRSRSATSVLARAPRRQDGRSSRPRSRRCSRTTGLKPLRRSPRRTAGDIVEPSPGMDSSSTSARPSRRSESQRAILERRPGHRASRR